MVAISDRAGTRGCEKVIGQVASGAGESTYCTIQRLLGRGKSRSHTVARPEAMLCLAEWELGVVNCRKVSGRGARRYGVMRI